MSEPAWVEHAIWWQVYPLGFVGAFPADPPPTADEHRLRRVVEWLDHAVELGASGIALGPVFASQHPRLRHHRPLPHRSAARRRRATSTSSSPRRTDAVCGSCSTASSTTSAPTSPATATRVDGGDDLVVPPARQRLRDVRGPRRADHAEPRQPRGRRLRRRRDVALAAPRRRRLAPRRRVRGARPRSGPQVLPRVREQFRDAWFVGEVIHGDYAAIVSRRRRSTPSRSTNCGRRSGAASTTATSTNSTTRWRGTTSSSTTFVPMTFVGNHDVTRIASKLDERPPRRARARRCCSPSAARPSVYAGDEWAYRGVKEERFGGDDAVRPEFAALRNGCRRPRRTTCSGCTSI